MLCAIAFPNIVVLRSTVAGISSGLLSLFCILLPVIPCHGFGASGVVIFSSVPLEKYALAYLSTNTILLLVYGIKNVFLINHSALSVCPPINSVSPSASSNTVDCEPVCISLSIP